jgi:hypothetical protein
MGRSSRSTLGGPEADVYSLVNAPTIGFDLARLPTGASVATVLLEALAVQTPDGIGDLTGFDSSFGPDPRRAAAWLEVSSLAPPARLDDALSAFREVIDRADRADREPDRGHRELEPAMAALTTAYFGGLDDLLGLVRLDILDEAPTHVVAMCSDAIAAAYGGRQLGDEVRGLLGAPWIAATRGLGGLPVDLGPHDAELRRVLDRIPLLTRAEAVVLAEGAAASESDWGRCMHAAAWAAYLAGRLRPAAAAQFQAVRALRASTIDAGLVARGVWNAITGCLQAIVMHDLLDEVNYGVLVAPWESAISILG